MSKENVELALRAHDAMNRRDLDGFLAVMDDDVEARPRLTAVEGHYRGHEAIRRWWENTMDAFPDYRSEVDEVRDLGDKTIVHFRITGHGAGSDAPFEQDSWQCLEWRGGKLVRWLTFRTEADALRAAGLSE
jgi:ketosteroid isomerase-like protein